eukprot:GHVL01024428.1.p1 GENE.GHVL01024428.1~~GHVL01024428.1.p1  ORF type:complete len:408 (+),score=72.87 GHVL01024428.1:1047-2270(+)
MHDLLYQTGPLLSQPKQRTFNYVGILIIGIFIGAAIALFASNTHLSTPAVGPVILASQDTGSQCQKNDFTSKTLKLAYELTFPALFLDSKGEKKFEASDVIKVGDHFYAVCDNSWALMRFGEPLSPFLKDNVQIGDPHMKKEDSGWEALMYIPETHNFLVVRESIKKDNEFRAIIEEIKIKEEENGVPSGYEMIEECHTEFTFTSGNKGFEGAVTMKDINGNRLVIGLCEGNYCDSGHRGQDKGHGELVVMKREENKEGCYYKTLHKLKLPAVANFIDYSAISIFENSIAITSQESASLWVGSIKGLVTPPPPSIILTTNDGVSDVPHVPSQMLLPADLSSLEFTAGEVYQFPPNDNCETQYCNIEGIHFVNRNMFVAVSDKMKSGGRQSSNCLNKDQSVHVFLAPY